MAKKKEPKKANWEDWEKALNEVAELFVKTEASRKLLKEWADAYANREFNPPFHEVEVKRGRKTRVEQRKNPDFDHIEDARVLIAQNVRKLVARLEQAETALRFACLQENDFAEESARRRRDAAVLVAPLLTQIAFAASKGEIEFITEGGRTLAVIDGK